LLHAQNAQHYGAETRHFSFVACTDGGHGEQLGICEL